MCNERRENEGGEKESAQEIKRWEQSGGIKPEGEWSDKMEWGDARCRGRGQRVCLWGWEIVLYFCPCQNQFKTTEERLFWQVRSF